ncbi:MAG: translational GTPase TypA [Herpetosiphonaceae bacterium]|nr:translational GTPase TypA [Herpetosiphonaceae bacterium]
MQRNEVRNIAIIAHVDHGKTTLVDAMLKQSHIFRDNQQVAERMMDSNALERERGITILSKVTAVTYGDTRINIVDTPGHADFGGEVERVMNMVDGVLLLVDAVDGPMPQTKFVLRQALERGHKAIVVVNKIDRANARANHVVNATFDLFIDLGASDKQSEFSVVYTSATKGIAGLHPHEMTDSLEPLFEEILRSLPAPDVDVDGPAQMVITTMGFDEYKGKFAIGRIHRGTLRKAQTIVRIDQDGGEHPAKINQVFRYRGLERYEVDEAVAGDIVAITGINDAGIGETLADAAHPEQLPPIRVEEPTVRMAFSINNSPFGGREGTFVTSRKVRERLYQEIERDVALRVEDTASADTLLVSGRGELHLAILIENMRREGYEFQVAKPEVIFRDGPDGRQEPYELVDIEVPEAFQGTVVEMMGQRKGQMRDMKFRDDGSVHIVYHVPTRGLLGFRQHFLTATRGTGVMNALFNGYGPYAGHLQTRVSGSLLAWEQGTATAFGLNNAQERGQLFIVPGTEVYEGMIVGQHIREEDLEVNVARKKQLNNIRSSNAEEAIRLDTPRSLSLDDCIEYIADDELVEVTPKSLRLRKKLLDTNERRRQVKNSK